jgi:hypothetical protein
MVMMRVSELIEKLQYIKTMRGDLDVLIPSSDMKGYCDVENIYMTPRNPMDDGSEFDCIALNK